MKKQSAKYTTLRKAADMLRQHGQGGDSVLAHISPSEANYMHENFGSNINPYTGLPQYGFFRKIEKALRKPFKMIAPIAGSLVGGMLGGPAGAIAGGALGGGLTSKRHPFDHALGGAALGFGHGLVSPMIGKSLGLDPSSIFGKMAMTGEPSLFEQAGLGGLGLLGGRRGNQQEMPREALPPPDYSMFGNQQETHPTVGGMGGLGDLFGSAGKLGNLIDTALLATTLAGTLGAKQKMPAYGSPENETLDQAIQRNKHVWGPEDAYVAPVQRNEKPKAPPKGYRRSQWKFFPTPEEQEEQLNRVNEEMAEPNYQRRFAKGGAVKGYYDGSEGGQSDTIPVNLPEKSYIMDATTVSLAGDGNSKNGAKRIKKQLIGDFERSSFTRDLKPSRNIKALLSDGEFEISPEEVAAAGGGNIDNGVKKFDKFRKNIRKHKGVKKFLPPKSKPLKQYLR